LVFHAVLRQRLGEYITFGSRLDCVRLFVGLPIENPGALVGMVAEQSRGILVPAANLHVTLAFLGKPKTDIDSIKSALASIRSKSLSVQIDRQGVFRTRHGEVHWLGFGEGNNAIVQLSEEVRGKLRPVADFDNKAIIPHVTLSRKAEKPIVDLSPKPWLEFREFCLYASIGDGGVARYEKLAIFPLAPLL
jgi:2'-5' RNA ligase